MRMYLLILIFILSCSPYLLAEDQPSVVVPETWKPKKIATENAYMNITGDYNLLGESAPGTPTIFLERWPLSLDTMTGGDIPDDIQKKVTRVHIEQNNCSELTLTFFSKDSVLAKRSILGAEDVKISCDRDSFKRILTSAGSCGEGGCRTMDIDSSFYLSGDGSLILYSKYSGVDRFLFFWKHFKKEYLVRFKTVKP